MKKVLFMLGMYSANQRNTNGVTIFGKSRTETGYQRYDTHRPRFVGETLPDGSSNPDFNPLTAEIDEKAERVPCIIFLHAGLVEVTAVLPESMQGVTIYCNEEEFRQSVAAQKPGRNIDALVFREFQTAGSDEITSQKLDLRKTVAVSIEMDARKQQNEKRKAFLQQLAAGTVKSPLPPISTPQSLVTTNATAGQNAGLGGQTAEQRTGAGASTGSQLKNPTEESKEVAMELAGEDATNLDQQTHQQQTGADDKDLFPNRGQ